MEWTRDKTLTLINEYRKRRGLWDMTHEDYRKKDVKYKLLCEVSQGLGGNIPITDVEKKFHTLRTQYHREISRMKRKEPYNSKWFGFKNLQFLSSPKACRMGKGRIKSEITEDGTVTTKYIIRDTQHDSSGGSANSSVNANDEYITIAPPRRKSNNRSRDLEKLIEETTKDDIEESKPKLTIKEITVPLESPNFSTHISDANDGGHELNVENHDNNQHQMQVDVNPIETIHLEEELSYETGTDVNAHHHNQHHQHHVTTQQQSHYLPSVSTKRIYFDQNGSAAILATQAAASTPQTTTTNTKQIRNRNAQTPQLQAQQSSQQNSPIAGQQLRDEFSTYGEYVANEMRSITNREVLIALKHKINMALFEASMAEIQK